MKIINSHYIPLPEPRWLIVDAMGSIHEQIGTLTVVEGERKDGYGIVTHSYPVVANAITDEYDENKEDGKSQAAALAPADGYALDDTEVCECFRLCPTNHRVVPYLKFNLMAMKYFTSNNPDDFDLGDTIRSMRSCSVRLDFPKESEQNIQLTISTSDTGLCYLVSDLSGLCFVVLLGAFEKKRGVMIDSEKVLMEIVNQARAYLLINPHYKFHFTTAMESIQYLVDKLNDEVESYLERKED